MAGSCEHSNDGPSGSIKGWKFLTISATTSFSGRTLLYGVRWSLDPPQMCNSGHQGPFNYPGCRVEMSGAGSRTHIRDHGWRLTYAIGSLKCLNELHEQRNMELSFRA
jgi:hypothetical protein